MASSIEHGFAGALPPTLRQKVRTNYSPLPPTSTSNPPCGIQLSGQMRRTTRSSVDGSVRAAVTLNTTYAHRAGFESSTRFQSPSIDQKTSHIYLHRCEARECNEKTRRLNANVRRRGCYLWWGRKRDVLGIRKCDQPVLSFFNCYNRLINRCGRSSAVPPSAIPLLRLTTRTRLQCAVATLGVSLTACTGAALRTRLHSSIARYRYHSEPRSLMRHKKIFASLFRSTEQRLEPTQKYVSQSHWQTRACCDKQMLCFSQCTMQSTSHSIAEPSENSSTRCRCIASSDMERRTRNTGGTTPNDDTKRGNIMQGSLLSLTWALRTALKLSMHEPIHPL
jgi:hypothetical protein